MVFRPRPKPIKEEKKKSPGQWVNGCFVSSFEIKLSEKPKKKKGPKKYRTSEGELVSDGVIQKRKSKAYEESPKPNDVMCQCCGNERAVDHDHTISERRCKILQISDLIYTEANWSLSCRTCHAFEWESYKSGLFQHHNNVVERMLFMKIHDIEGFRKRMNYITDKELIKKLL